MIGLDSNVVLRAITGDDPVQSPAARRFLSRLSEESPGVLNAVVLAEIAWTLKTAHKYRRQEILACIEDLMNSTAYYVIDRDAVNRALDISAQHSLEFADALIGEINRTAGCTTTMTFDTAASHTPGFAQLL